MDSQNLESGFFRNAVTPVVFTTGFSKIEPRDRLYFGGSCFAVNLHDFWKDRFLPCSASPFGNIYNPRSLTECFCLLAGNGRARKEELFLHKGLWRHSLFGSATADTDRERLLDVINSRLEEHSRLLSETDYLILTLGTAFVYDEVSTGRTVNNCHRRPSSDFRRHPLGVDEIAGDLKTLSEAVRKVNPGMRLILSLSPVRHIRDGADENSLSKALLRCGIDQFLKEEMDSLYFPSSEIMLDELRDYRWYADDLVHPSPKAVGYIMNRFCNSLGSRDLEVYLREAGKIKQMRDHRILFPESEEGRKFIEARKRETSGFRERYPFARI